MENEKRQQFDKSFKTELAGKPWTICPTGDMPDMDGICCHDEDMIQIVALADEDTFLETAIHEALHAEFPWMKEFAVHNAAGELQIYLKKLGFRKP